MIEVIMITVRVIISIVSEWWIVFLFLLSLEMVLGFWILWLLEYKREIVAPLGIISLLTSVFIPLREKYIVEEISIFQRGKDWLVRQLKIT